MSLFIVDRYPRPDASGTYINDVIWVQFSKQIDPTTANYYNFTVNRRDDYTPVEGEVHVQGLSGNINDAIAVFVPTNYLDRNTSYAVLIANGIKSKDGLEHMDHDDYWYFQTGNIAISGNIGDTVYDLDPSGVTAEVEESSDPSGVAIIPLAYLPLDGEASVPINIPYISIEFTGELPASGINWHDYISLTSKKVLG